MNERCPLATLRGWSATGHSAELRKNLLEQVFIIEDLALLGQLTAVYGAPNSGKTLLILDGLIQQVKSGVIDGDDIYYVNADDDCRGGTQKLAIAEPYGIHFLIPNLRGFEIKNLRAAMRELIECGKAKGIIIVLDTLEKVADLMDKRACSDFTALAREFVQAGGTVLMLAHTNKHKIDGEPVAGGTSDVIDDSDCACILDTVSDGDGLVTVEIRNVKARGNIPARICYQYRKIPGGTYSDLLGSVTRVDKDTGDQLKQAASRRDSLLKNASIISSINKVIEKNYWWPQDAIVKAVSKNRNAGIVKVREILKRHCGEDYAAGYRWREVKQKGVCQYQKLAEQEKFNLAEPIASPDVRDFHLNALHDVIKGPSHKPHKSHKSHNHYD